MGLNRFKIKGILCAYSISLLLLSGAQAEDLLRGKELPKIEAGVAVGFVHLPDYPGADEGRLRVLPLPYVIYRGEILRSDREGGLRSRFINREKVEADLSFGAAFPVNGSKNKAREGMPDLDWIGEIGPQLTYRLYRTHMVQLDFKAPVRFAFSTNFKRYDSRGYVFGPGLHFRHRALFSDKGAFSARLGASYGTRQLLRYFYEVSPEFETPDRSAYEAQGGFFGTNFSVSYGHMFKNKITAFTGVSLNSYEGAKNRQSPLMKDRFTQSFFVMLAWGFYESPHFESGEIR